MCSQLYGFDVIRRNQVQKDNLKTFATPVTDDGAVTVSAGGVYGTYVDLDGSIKTEADLVTKYREMSLQPEIDMAIEEIVNEAIVNDDGEPTVKIIADDNQIPPKLSQIIEDEFENILTLLEFQTKSFDVFRRFYIDGRMYFHIVIDEMNLQEGIKELRFLDPRKIRKIKEVVKQRVSQGAGQVADIPQTAAEYFFYSEKAMATRTPIVNMGGNQVQGIKIAKDAIVHVTSGIIDSTGKLVLSYLHQAIKPLNQLKSLEDAAIIYTLARAPQRRIFYIDTGQLPPMKAEQYIRKMMVKFKNRLVYDAESGEVRDDRKFMCYALDTKIPLLDGRTLTLQNLIDEHEQGKLNWVYSADPKTGKFAPGPVSWAGITKKNAQVVKVTFDNGKSIVCTPDHKFPVWGKGFVEAKDLVGESIIPGYRRQKEVTPGNTKYLYEQIYKNDTKTWVFTHREVAKWKDEHSLREEMLHNFDKYNNSDKKTVHHKDFNRYNNNPENLAMMNRYDHFEYHGQCAGFLKKNKSEDFTPEWRSKLSAKAKERSPICKTWKIISPDGKEIITENLNEFCRQNDLNRSNIKYNHSRGYKAEVLTNHKAISIEWLSEKIDVGCITIDLEETYHSYHTYLLDAGVYTKNTMLEDFWLARREGGRGTEISTIGGDSNIFAGSQVIVDYFLKKLNKSLKVPVSRLDPETVYLTGRSTQISRDELKFSKFIDRLRLRFNDLFLQALEKQLILKELISPEDWEVIRPKLKFKYNRDNYFSELKDQEIKTEMMNVLERMHQYAGIYWSHTEIRKKVIKQTDEDIQRNDAEIMQEMNDPRFQPVVPPMGPMGPQPGGPPPGGNGT